MFPFLFSFLFLQLFILFLPLTPSLTCPLLLLYPFLPTKLFLLHKATLILILFFCFFILFITEENPLSQKSLSSFEVNRLSKQPRLVTWNPSPESFVKLNVDGSSFGNPRMSGFGGLFRNHFGHWLLGFSGGCGYTTNINVELQAIAHGLIIARQQGYDNLICESDSKVALSFIEDGVARAHPHAPIIDFICSFKDLNWNLSFIHSLREGNACADWLAKYGSTMDQGVKTWNNCPTVVSSSLLADAMGIERNRV